MQIDWPFSKMEGSQFSTDFEWTPKKNFDKGLLLIAV